MESTEQQVIDGKVVCIKCEIGDLLIEVPVQHIFRVEKDKSLNETGEMVDFGGYRQAAGFCQVCGRKWDVTVNANGKLESAKVCAQAVEYTSLCALIQVLCPKEPHWEVVPLSQARLYFSPGLVDTRLVYVHCNGGWRRMRLDDEVHVGMTVLTQTTLAKVVNG